MKNPLIKRLPREFTGEIAKYIVIFIFMTAVIGLISGFLIADGSVLDTYNKSFDKYNVEDGWVHVTLNADHKYFYVKVADSGVGIPEDCQDQVFDRFYRVDKARSRDTGGTGLGLAITKSVVSLHNGEIKLYSKVGEGTTFTLRVPLKYKG